MTFPKPRRTRPIHVLALAVALNACLLTAFAGPLSAAPIQRDPQDPHLFFYQGETLLLAGYYPGLQALVVSPQVDPSDPFGPGSRYYRDLIDTLTDTSAYNHVNLIRVMLTPNMALEKQNWLHPYQRATSPSCSLSSGTGCTINAQELGLTRNRFDLDRWNEDFFTYWDQVIGYAEARGVIVQVNFWSGTHHRKRKNVNLDPEWIPFQYGGRVYEYYEGGNNVNGLDIDDNSTMAFYEDPDAIERQKDFIDKAVQTLGHHDNIIWEIINEGQATPLPSAGVKGAHPWYGEMRSQIRSAEMSSGHSPHMIMPFDSPDHRVVAGHYIPGDGDDDDADYQNVHTGLVSQYDQYSVPIIADNDCCFTPGSPEELRKKAWTSFVSGAHPEMLVWPVSATGSPWGLGVVNGVRDPNHPTQQGIRYTGFVRRFVQEADLDLRDMEPRDDLVANESPAGFVWARAVEGSRYVVYFYNGGSATILGLPTNFEASWFSPRSSSWSSARPVGTHFTAPSADDWVLFIDGTNEIHTPVSADSYVAEDTANANYGSRQDLQIRDVPSDNGTFSFLKFNVPSFSGSVVSAQLRLRAQETPIEGLGVYKMNNMSWSEYSINYNNWDRNGTVTFSFLGGETYLAPNLTHFIDVTSAVTGSGVVNIGLASSYDKGGMDFYSRESSYKPKLFIDTTGPTDPIVDASADAWVWAGNAGQNYGTRTDLRVRNDPQTQGRHAFLRFEVPNYPGTLVSSKLRIHTGPNPIPNATIYRMTNMQWNESTVNWNNWDNMGTVGFEYVVGTGPDPLPVNSWEEFDITSAIQGPATTLDLGLTTQYDQGGLSFSSRESGWVPVLVIEWTQ